MTLSEILATIVPGCPEAYFFDVLDDELQKIEVFFKKHEREAFVHATVLQKQLKELKDHRKLFHASPASHDCLNPTHPCDRKSFRGYNHRGLLQLTSEALLETFFHITIGVARE